MSQTTSTLSKLRISIIMFSLVFAGEMIFSLPFHVARFFRPTFLSAFELSNTQLGDVFAVYGITAMLVYFPGGVIADRFSGRRLMACSLALTALGGLFFARLPDAGLLKLLFGYWGVTTILLFWAAMIKVTRQVGGDRLQGRAFGVLDGGRGLVAAGVASIAVFLLSQVLPSDVAALTHEARKAAIQQVIYFYSTATLIAAVLVWVAIPESSQAGAEGESRFTTSQLRPMMSKPSFWWISIIVVCAYCGYKGVDNYALYASQVLGLDELKSARLTSEIAYARPVVAVLAGVVADRILASRTIVCGFAVMVAAYLVLAFFEPTDALSTLFKLNMLVSVCGVFAIRAVYFALLQEDHLPVGLTGTAVGVISVIGFTPDIFFAPMAGRILDAAPGIAGHQNYFTVLSVIAVAGLLATILFMYHSKARRLAATDQQSTARASTS